MFSIENFYFILHQQLLKPLKLHDVQYNKFGSTSSDDLIFGKYYPIQHVYGKVHTKSPVCYFFDQEPINRNSVDKCMFTHTSTSFKLLANSEHSDLKQNILNEDHYSDWYYFFHGFAALDWFRDAEYFDQSLRWSRPYISLNRLHVNDRSYRLNLIARLIKRNLINDGYVSLHLDHTEFGSWQEELNNSQTKLSQAAQELILKYVSSSLTLDCISSDGSSSADFGHQEFELWKSGFWHIITETVFYYNKFHLTEKIFKPIVSQRPFILAAAPGNLKYLKSYGFESFSKWIDESYDDIVDNDDRLDAIATQTQKICSMSSNDLRDMHREMIPVLEHNFYHFFGDFKKRIVNELVDNFETSIRIWNNGRIDGKELPLHNINLPEVKRLLLQ